jgi:hypothetical protein
VDKARASTMITRRTSLLILLAAGLAFSIGAASNIGMQIQATAQQQNEEIYRIQETAMSSAAPVAHTGNLPHAVVFALPIRDDGKIYTGQVTFTASKPIEIEVYISTGQTSHQMKHMDSSLLQ